MVAADGAKWRSPPSPMRSSWPNGARSSEIRGHQLNSACQRPVNAASARPLRCMARGCGSRLFGSPTRSGTISPVGHAARVISCCLDAMRPVPGRVADSAIDLFRNESGDQSFRDESRDHSLRDQSRDHSFRNGSDDKLFRNESGAARSGAATLWARRVRFCDGREESTAGGAGGQRRVYPSFRRQIFRGGVQGLTTIGGQLQPLHLRSNFLLARPVPDLGDADRAFARRGALPT